MKSRMFKKDYDLGFLDERTFGLVKVEHESKVARILIAIAAVVVVVGWILFA